MPNTTKPWWRSRMLWFNGLVAVAAVAETSLHLVRDQFGPEGYATALFAFALINALLRVITKEAITNARPSTKGKSND